MSVVDALGPYACALFWILSTTEDRFRKEEKEALPKDEHTTLWRGLSLTDEDIKEYEDMKGDWSGVSMKGQISTSMNMNTGLQFAKQNKNVEDQIPVLQKISW